MSFAKSEQVQNFPQDNNKCKFSPVSKKKAVYTEGAGPVCKCTGQCTLEGSVQGGV